MSQNSKSPAMVLYEFTIKRKYSPPKYVLFTDKNGLFHSNVNVATVSVMGLGWSKKAAKQNAASKALEKLASQGLYEPESMDEFHYNTCLQIPDNFIGILLNVCRQCNLESPQFNEVLNTGPLRCMGFTSECIIDSLKTKATASTKKQAKQLAAKEMLEKIKDKIPHSQLSESSDEVNLLREKDHKVKAKYESSFCRSTQTEKADSTFNNFILDIRQIVKEKNLELDDFCEPFKRRTRKDLEYIFNKLGISYTIKMFQEEPPISCAVFGTNTSSLTLMAMGSTKESAELNVIHQVFVVLDTYMTTVHTKLM